MANLLRGKGILSGARDAQLLHAEVKRRPLDSQSRSGPVWTGDNPPGLLKNLANVVSLRIFQSHGLQRFRFRRSPQARERWAQDISGGEDYASLDKILQLTSAPGPVVCDERRHRFQWPGNIRELQNFIERSVILTSGNVLHPPLASLKSAAEAESFGAITLEDAERDHIRKTLEQTRWVVAGPNGAAARLGIKRSTLYFRMQKLGISRTNKDVLSS